MKAAVIGGGFAGRTHVQALRAIGVEPYLVITTRTETAKRFAEEMGIPHYSGADQDGYEAAFRPEIEAVHVCTPPTSHARIVKELLLHGKNVLCEKPIALDLKEAEALVNAVENIPAAESRENITIVESPENVPAKNHEKPLCALTFNVRYHMACQRAKELIESGAFGRPILIHGNYMQEFHALPAPWDWRYDPELGGKMRAITEIGSHWIDLAQYLSGKKVTAVSAQTANFWPEREISNGVMTPPGTGEKEAASEKDTVHVISEDAATVNLQFEDGAIGSVVLSEVSPGRGNRLTMEITCENGNLWWNEEENNILHTAKKGEGIRSEVFAFGNGFGDTFEELLRRFYEELKRRNNAAGLPTFKEGLQVAAVCSAIGESAEKDGKWIRV
ncbi:MAG: Gfo/Idh/MocA family oxidoreductase [Lachnospiraceae bacterium]|nr:Gfo/Idh/MocA family oxidoreductase [Lachnospiraceae bacterium]